MMRISKNVQSLSKPTQPLQELDQSIETVHCSRMLSGDQHTETDQEYCVSQTHQCSQAGICPGLNGSVGVQGHQKVKHTFICVTIIMCF